MRTRSNLIDLVRSNARSIAVQTAIAGLQCSTLSGAFCNTPAISWDPGCIPKMLGLPGYIAHSTDHANCIESVEHYNKNVMKAVGRRCYLFTTQQLFAGYKTLNLSLLFQGLHSLQYSITHLLDGTNSAYLYMYYQLWVHGYLKPPIHQPAVCPCSIKFFLSSSCLLSTSYITQVI